jgi:hypothetical protein
MKRLHSVPFIHGGRLRRKFPDQRQDPKIPDGSLRNTLGRPGLNNGTGRQQQEDTLAEKETGVRYQVNTNRPPSQLRDIQRRISRYPTDTEPRGIPEESSAGMIFQGGECADGGYASPRSNHEDGESGGTAVGRLRYSCPPKRVRITAPKVKDSAMRIRSGPAKGT